MALIKSEIAKADHQKIWPYSLPRVAAESAHMASAEAALGFEIDNGYRDFLLHADGWPAFYQSVDLFGTPELLGNERMRQAQQMLSRVERQVIESSGVAVEALLPIAATEQDLDLFVMTTPKSSRPGEVIWFAGGEVQRFTSFAEYFLAMEDYNRRELAALAAHRAHS
jgi:hypothetical protein